MSNIAKSKPEQLAQEVQKLRDLCYRNADIVHKDKDDLSENNILISCNTCLTNILKDLEIELPEKENKQNNVLDKIQQITGYTYKFKDTGHDSIGVTAQDVEKVFPELVHGEEGTKSLQYSGLIGALIESVKELSTKVAALEAA